MFYHLQWTQSKIDVSTGKKLSSALLTKGEHPAIFQPGKDPQISHISTLGHPWAYGEKANEGEEVHVQGQPEKIQAFSHVLPCRSSVTASAFSVFLRASEAETML